MPRFQVREGQQLAHAGVVLVHPAIVELPRAVADDQAVRGAVQEVDADGKPVAPVPVDDLEKYRLHEQVSILRDRRAAAQQVVDDLTAQLTAKEDALAAAVAASAAPSKVIPIKPAAPAAPSKE